MAPVLLRIRTTGDSVFAPFEEIDNPDDLALSWRVCSKVRDTLESGSRLENLSWRLWHLHQSLVASNKLETPQQFKRISSCAAKRLSKAQFARKKPSHQRLEKKQSHDPKSDSKGSLGKSRLTSLKSPVIKTTSLSCTTSQRPLGSALSSPTLQMIKTVSDGPLPRDHVAPIFHTPDRPSIRRPSSSYTQSLSTTSKPTPTRTFSHPLPVQSIPQSNSLVSSSNAMVFDAMDMLPSSALSLLTSLESQSMEWSLSTLPSMVSTTPTLSTISPQVLQQSLQIPQSVKSQTNAVPVARTSSQGASNVRATTSSLYAKHHAQEPLVDTESTLTPNLFFLDQDMIHAIPQISSPRKQAASALNRINASLSTQNHAMNMQMSSPISSSVPLDMQSMFPCLSASTPTNSLLDTSMISLGSNDLSMSQFNAMDFNFMNDGQGPLSFFDDKSGSSANVFSMNNTFPQGIGSNSNTVSPASLMSAPQAMLNSFENKNVFGNHAGYQETKSDNFESTRPCSASVSQSETPVSTPSQFATPVKQEPRDESKDMTPQQTNLPAYYVCPPGCDCTSHTPVACENCSATTTPLWRRGPSNEILCNACGLYLKIHGSMRPKKGFSGSGSKGGKKSTFLSLTAGGSGDEPHLILECNNCGTRNTPLWRREKDQDGGQDKPLCNACGLYIKLHGRHRPLKLKKDVVRKRPRHSHDATTGSSSTQSLIQQQKKSKSSTDEP